MTQPTPEQLEVVRVILLAFDLDPVVFIGINGREALKPYLEIAKAVIQTVEARCAEMLENRAQAMLNIDPDGAQEVAEALIMAARSIRSQS